MEKKIKIKCPDGIHGYGIEFYGLENIEYDFYGFTYDGIKFTVNTQCPKPLSYFYQAGFAIPEHSGGYGYIEFWNANQFPDLFLDFVLSLGQKFTIEVS